MIAIQGKGVSGGIAAGPLCFYRRVRNAVRRYQTEDREAEWSRFLDARNKTAEQLGELTEKVRTETGEAAAKLFETHRAMASDPDFEEAVSRGIREMGLNAEAAVTDAAAQFTAMFTAMGDVYMQERAADVKDVAGRMIDNLMGVAREPFAVRTPVILAADDLAPSETVQLDRSRILAFITERGSETSHTAILARTLGIPAIVGVGGQLKQEYEGREILVDGTMGNLVIDPDPITREYYIRKREEQQRTRELLKELKGQPSETKDGRAIRICCNIGDPADVPLVLENDGEGIGLFRSEFLYMDCRDCPSEEYQFQVYKEILSAMGGREVVIRTLDIGSDKRLDYLGLPKEENPAMGIRALRLCLNRPDLFRTQLRALYRASVYGNLRILFPMVTSVWEVREGKLICEQVKTELQKEGIPYDPDIPIGVMIETPAAAVISDDLAEAADFFSCGTNDLTQYALACDRQNPDLGRFYDPRHPAVLRLLRLVAENAHKKGIRVAVCGELGADPEMTEFFLSIGIDELSVSPMAVLPLRKRVREIE